MRYPLWIILCTGVGGASVISSKAFHDFDLKCPPTETVSGIATKKYVSSTGTRDFELTVFCRSIAGPNDPRPIANDSSCRYAAKRNTNGNNTIEENDCNRGEYVNGFKGTFENGHRTINFRCCAASNGRQDRRSCRTVGPESVIAVAMAGLRDPGTLRTGCPRNVMSTLNVVHGKMTAKFCPFKMNNTEYEAYCSSDEKEESLLEKFISTGREDVSEKNEDASGAVNDEWMENLQLVPPGQETKYGQSFRVECQFGQALSQLQWRLANGEDGQDVLYTLHCHPISTQGRESIEKTISRFVHPNYTGTVSCSDNRAICGFYSGYSRTRREKRVYALACCEGSNWYSMSTSEQVSTIIKAGQLTEAATISSHTAGSSYKRIKSINITTTDQYTRITATFQSYFYDDKTRFSKNTTLYKLIEMR